MVGIFAFVSLLTGALNPLDRALLQWRFDLLPRPANHQLVLVEIDAQSLHELNTWPWPRTYHAQLIDRLLDAGVRQIAMDVDFSARSTPDDDRALSQAVLRAGDRLILPTFVQGARLLSTTPAYENKPRPADAKATRLGLANVYTEADGRVWRYPVAEELPSGYRPSLAIQLAGSGVYRVPDFLIDYGIQAETVTRLSYVDVLRGRVDPHLLAGRDVIVGSTAAELGDHLAVPIYRAIPGVLIHALAYESIVQGRMIQRTGLAVTALGIVVIVLLLGPFMGSDENTWPRALAAGLATSVAIAAGVLAVQKWYPLSVDSAAWHGTVFCLFVTDGARRLRVQAILLFRQRMAQTHGRALMRSVVEDSFDGIVIVSETGRIDLANRAALRILGHSSPLIGLDRDAVLPGLKELPLPVSGSAASHPAHEVQVRRDDGSRASLEVMVGVSELRVSKHRYERRKRTRRVYIYTFRDVTARRQMVQAQGQALEAALAASRAKSEFLANMSHELRTPLNAIIGFSEAILEQVFGPIGNSRYHAYVHDIHASGTHLLEVIQQVLDVSRIEAGTLVLKEEVVDLGQVSSECETIIRGWLAKAPRHLHVTIRPELPAIRADRTQIKQIFLNLLSNAVKFTAHHGQIELRVDLDTDGSPIVDVTDNGAGIPEDKIERLGEPFFQANASADGTGLGLYLVRHFIAMHGGTIAFDSKVGRGTRVRITFPTSRIIDIPPRIEPPSSTTDDDRSFDEPSAAYRVAASIPPLHRIALAPPI